MSMGNTMLVEFRKTEDEIAMVRVAKVRVLLSC